MHAAAATRTFPTIPIENSLKDFVYIDYSKLNIIFHRIDMKRISFKSRGYELTTEPATYLVFTDCEDNVVECIRKGAPDKIVNLSGMKFTFLNGFVDLSGKAIDALSEQIVCVSQI